MKCVVFLTLWALVSSVPRRGGYSQWPQNWMGLQVAGQQEWMVPQQMRIQNSLPQLPQNFAEQGLIQWQQGPQQLIAQQQVQQIIEQFQQQKETQVQIVIQQLQQQLQNLQQWSDSGMQMGTTQTQQVEIMNAIEQLQQIQQQNVIANQGSQKMILNQLEQTLEAALEAQMVSKNIEGQLTGLSGQIPKLSGQKIEVFETMVQKLMDESNIEDLKVEIARQEIIARQLQQQQQFLNQQVQQIQTQLSVLVQQQSQTIQVQKLQLVLQNLQQQIQQLLQQQLARQLVVKELQQVLINQQQQLQQDILNEQINDQATRVTFSQMGNLWSQGNNQWLQGLQSNNPWFQVTNHWSQMNKQLPQVQKPKFVNPLTHTVWSA